jgi:DNA-directed RNA polymerase subunit F
MMDFEVVEERDVTFQEVKEILSAIDDKELNAEQKLALEHIKRCKLLPKKKALEMIEELKALNMRKLRMNYIIQMANLVPKDTEDLRVILAGSNVAFNKADLEKIFSVVSKYVK